MFDINAIEQRIKWLEITIKDLVSTYESAPEAIGAATRAHMATGIAQYSLELKHCRDALKSAQAINEARDDRHVTKMILESADLIEGARS